MAGPALLRQAAALGLAFCLGLASGLLYDLLRPPRRALGRAGALLDALYCLAVGAGLFVFAMSAGDGRLGQWELAAALLGFLAYLHVLSPLLLPPIRRLADGTARLCQGLEARAKKLRKIEKNSLKNSNDAL